MTTVRIFTGLLSLLLIMTTACQKKEDTPPCSYPKNAKLKRIVICQYVESECPSRECDDIISIEEEYEYDGLGRIERILLYPKYENGVLTSKGNYNLYKYNSSNQLVKIEYYSAYREDYLLYQTVTYTYSDDGKKTKENIEFPEKGNQYTLYKYTNNRLTRIENYELNTDELEDYILLEYDDSGNLIKETKYNKDRVEKSYILHEFENGVNVRSYNGSSEFIKTYDENDNLVLLEEFHGAGSSRMNFKFKYEYYD